MQTITNLKNVKNEIRHLDNMEQTEDNEKNKKLENRLDELFIKKRRITDTLLTINTAYSQIDDIFAREIILAEIQKKNKFLFQINSIFKIICCPIKGCLKNYDTMFIPNELFRFSYHVSGSSDGSRGLAIGGYHPTVVDTIQWMNIGTTSKAADFGELTQARYDPASLSGD